MVCARKTEKESRIQAFKFACGSYQANRRMLERLEAETETKSEEELLAEASARGGYAKAKTDLLVCSLQKKLLQDSIDAVETPLAEIRRRFGEEAEETVREKYIAGRSARQLAKEKNMTLSMLYRRMTRWLNAVL